MTPAQNEPRPFVDRSAGAPGAPLGRNEGQSLPRALILVALVTLAGSVGFVEIEGWSFWRSFYFTLITITTVGYGDEGLSDEGKKFATLILIGGVTAASYTFATIVQASVASQLAWRKRMNKQIQKLRNHTIVCGFGRLGRSVCEKLSEREQTFVVIERDAARFASAVERGFLAVQGTASEDDSLQVAGLEHASYVVAAVDSFAENLVIAMEARDVRPEAIVVARAERDEDELKLERAGVARVLCPFRSGGYEAVEYITRPRVADFLARASMGDGGIALAEVRVREGSELVGVSLAEYGSARGDRISFVAHESESGEVAIPPRGCTRLAVGDHLIVAGDPDQIAKMNELAGHRRFAA